MTIKNSEIADCDLWVQAQILNDLKRVLHVRPLSNVTHNTNIESLSLELQTTHLEKVSGKDLLLFILEKSLIDTSFFMNSSQCNCA